MHPIGRPRRPLSMTGLVAELRRTLADPDQPEPLRARRPGGSGRLADDRRARAARSPSRPTRRRGGGCGRPPGPRSRSGPVTGPLTISASTLEGLITCPAQWFLSREAGRGGGELGEPGLRQGRARRRRPDRQGRDRLTRRRRRRPDAAGRRGVGAAGVPHPVVVGPRAGGGPRRAGPLRGLARAAGARTVSRPSRGCRPR